MTEERTITKIGIYQLLQHASVNDKTEFLKHLELKQNVVFVSSLNDQIEMNKLCSSSAVLKTIPLNDGKSAHFQFTFNNLSNVILKKIFYSVIDHSESSGNLPEYFNSHSKFRTTINNKIFYINIWRVDVSPLFQVEIY